MWKIIWIDLWTTNSCVAFMEWWEAKVIPNLEWNRTTPSIVATSKDGTLIVGTPAKRQSITNPLGTIFSAKRFIGRKFSEVWDEVKNAPFKVVAWSDWAAMIEFNGKQVRPEEIGAHVLGKLKEDAEKYLWTKITEAVITVPAYFNDDQRQATINAWKIAWLEVKRIINEPTAAALAYWSGKNKKNEKIAVYDLWGWTFDISVLEISEEWTFEVLSTNWDTHLGWDDFDKRIVDYIVDEFKKDQAVDLRNDPMALQRVRDEAEKAKKELSSTTSYDINLPYITVDATWPKNLMITISRAQFENLIMDLVEKSIEPCRKVLKDAWLSSSDLDEVIMVWGSTRIPLVQKKVEEFFGKKPNNSVNPDEAVAVWAAIQAWIIGWDVTDILLLDVAPLSLSIETMWGIATRMIARNTTIPTSKSETFSTAVDSQPSVEINVLQWEREMAADNKSLWRFVLDGIASAPRWVPQIEVTFDIDANWVLKVKAKDKGTWKEQHITIQWSTGMDDKEVDRLVKEAEAKREEDKAKKDIIEAKNHADSSIHQAEKMLEDNKDKIQEADKSEITSKVQSLKDELLNTSSTKDSISAKNKELNDVMMRVWQSMYSNQSNEVPQNDWESKKDDWVVDGDVEK